MDSRLLAETQHLQDRSKNVSTRRCLDDAFNALVDRARIHLARKTHMAMTVCSTLLELQKQRLTLFDVPRASSSVGKMSRMIILLLIGPTAAASIAKVSHATFTTVERRSRSWKSQKWKPRSERLLRFCRHPNATYRSAEGLCECLDVLGCEQRHVHFAVRAIGCYSVCGV